VAPGQYSGRVVLVPPGRLDEPVFAPHSMGRVEFVMSRNATSNDLSHGTALAVGSDLPLVACRHSSAASSELGSGTRTFTMVYC